MEPNIAHHYNGKYTVTCYQCQQTFLHREYLRYHIAKAHRKDPNEKKFSRCSYCTKPVSDKNMRKHVTKFHSKVETNSGDFKLVCNYCKNLIPRRNLQRHIYQTHRAESSMDLPENQVTLDDMGMDRAYRCSLCKAECDTIPDLDRHTAKVHTKKDYVDCKICGKSIVKRGMESHVKLVHSNAEKRFTCEYCGMKFGAETWLRHHQKELCVKFKGQKIPAPDKDVECEQCHKFYSNRTTLKLHINRYHAKIVNYKCADCSEGFYTAQEFRKHRLDAVFRGIETFVQKLAHKLVSQTNFLAFESVGIYKPASIPVFPIVEQKYLMGPCQLGLIV